MIADFIYSLPTWEMAVTIVGLFVFFANVGLYIVIRTVRFEVRKEHNDFVTSTSDLIGVFFAVLAGFIAVEAWETFSKAGDIAATEASLVNDLARDADGFPEPIRTQMLVNLTDYVDIVLKKEWPDMADGVEFGDEGWEPLRRLQKELVGFRSEDSIQVAIFSETLSRLNSLYDARRDRLLAATDHIASSVWWVVLIGAGITISLTFLFGMESYGMHVALTSTAAASLALMIVLIAAFDYPFRGEVQISPDAFEHAIQNMQRTGLYVHSDQGKK
jgi:hypothetical protein